MENSLLMKTEASYTLNFLIYIQNVFLNQNCSEEEFKFPYIPSKIAFKEKFEVHYKELWDMVSQRISHHPMNDMKIFINQKDLFYQSLFVDSCDNITRYSEIYQSFKIWWDSIAGRFSVENSIGEKSKKLYVELANSLKQKDSLSQKELNISLVFDECPLANLEISSYFVVIPIKDFIVNYKQLLTKLQESILN